MTQCEHCKERPASIHLTQIVNNSVTTLHLCEQCAEEKGVQTGAGLTKLPLSDFLATMGSGNTTPATARDEGLRCPSCRSSLKDFRESGRLGCPVCYETFAGHLRDLLRRLHGSSRHVGRQYLHVSQSGSRDDDRLYELREQLRRAIAAERFELAAELRDQIRVLE
jgi:protein arginine kinase activator